jgi:recombination protein RecR
LPAGQIETLIRQLARLPGIGPRSARRAVLAMLKRPETLLEPLAAALGQCAATVRTCSACGNLDVTDPCAVCLDPDRDRDAVAVVTDIDDLWAIERAGVFRGLYHVLGGTLSALDGRGPDDLGVARLLARIQARPALEVILALGATVEGQTTAHYLAERLRPFGCKVTRIAHGVPIGGELNYLDEGTLGAALRARQPLA